MKPFIRMLTWALLLALCVVMGAAAEEEKLVPAPDFTLVDQYGNSHTISEYKGRVVFLNFWATWCPYCIQEMPDIEALYHETGENQEDVVILGVASPSAYDTEDEAGVVAVLEENGFTYPTLMDPTGEMFTTYGASSLPTTWLIRADGNIMGYTMGAMSKEDMETLIRITKEATE